MATDNIAHRMNNLSLSSEYSSVLFNAADQTSWERVPRYLFRISSPMSDGYDDQTMCKSKAAKYDRDSARTDILSLDHATAARKLNSHLRWEGSDEDDNLISWTSSLAFAIQYVCYRNRCTRDASDLADVKLRIIDTRKFEKGTFISDLDLLSLLREHDDNLDNLAEMRKRPYDNQPMYYFGEYLSQGVMDLNGRSDQISAEELIEGGLFQVHPEWEDQFTAPCVYNPTWVRFVNDKIRAKFYQQDGEQDVTGTELAATLRIAEYFGPRWRLPVIANLLALRPRKPDDNKIACIWRRADIYVHEIKQWFKGETRVIATKENLPEVQQYDEIMRCMFFNMFHSRSIMNVLEDAKRKLLCAGVLWSEVDRRYLGSTEKRSHSEQHKRLEEIINTIAVD